MIDSPYLKHPRSLANRQYMALFRKCALLFLLLLIRLCVHAQQTNTIIVDWGDDTYSQLTSSFRNINFTQVATGFEHTIAIVGDSLVTSWGDNTYGQLQIPDDIVDPVKVAVGLGHSVVLQADGTVKAWGFNKFGQVDVSTFTDITDISAGDEHTALLHADGTVSVVSDGNATYDLTPPAGLSGIRAIASGQFHILALRSDSTVVAWGANEFGQSQVPALLDDVVAIDGGLFHSVALLSNGELVGWGDSDLFDQLELPFTSVGYSQLSVGSFHNLALSSTGQLSAWGSNRFGETLIPKVLQNRNITLISSGFAHNTVVASNTQPTEIIIPDTIFVSENVVLGTIINAIDATDPDTSDEHVYSLVPGAGSDDNDLFSIFTPSNKRFFDNDLVWGEGNFFDAVMTNTFFNYETDSLYYIRIRATDLGGLWTEKPVVIKILDSNEQPISLSLSNDTIREQQPAGTFIGTLTTRDPDLNDTFTYELAGGSGSDDNALFAIEDDRLVSAAEFLFADKTFRKIRVRSTDSGGLSVEEMFVIEIIPVNNPPEEILLSNNVVQDDSPVNTIIGLFSTVDMDAEDIHTYRFASGDGDDDNNAFTISDNSLLTNTELDSLTKSSYRIRVRSTDNGSPDSFFVEETFVILITSAKTNPVIANQEFNVRENEENGYEIGTVAAFGNEPLNYEISSGNPDNIFALDPDSGQLTLNDASFLDALVRPKYEMEVTVTDASGLSASATVIVNIIYVAAPPVAFDQVFEVEEETNNNTVIGVFTATSPKDIPLVFEILSGNSAGIFAIGENSGEIILANSDLLDADVTPLYTLTINVTDEIQNLSVTARATITVIDINLPPTSILLDNNRITDQSPTGTRIGILSTIDPNEEDFHIYTLVDGEGSSGNSAFRIEGVSLLSNEVFDVTERDRYSIRVRSTDNGNPNLFTEQVFDILVDARNLPIIPTAITPNGDMVNDRWDIVNIELFPSCTVEVYDASGQAVFLSNGYRSAWDGTFNGNVLPTASYYYLINLNNSANTQLTGTITILK